MSKNYLLIYSEQLATEIELLCQNIKASSNTLFQIRKSSSSVYANIREANYGQSKFVHLPYFLYFCFAVGGAAFFSYLIYRIIK